MAYIEEPSIVLGFLACVFDLWDTAANGFRGTRALKLPQSARAIIEDEKILEYLLSREHPIGKYKCVVLESIGYSLSNWPRLKQDVLDTFGKLDVQDVIEGEHGTKYLIRGSLKGPNGKVADLLSVWIVEKGTDVPRFVTIYPGGS